MSRQNSYYPNTLTPSTPFPSFSYSAYNNTTGIKGAKRTVKKKKLMTKGTMLSREDQLAAYEKFAAEKLIGFTEEQSNNWVCAQMAAFDEQHKVAEEIDGEWQKQEQAARKEMLSMNCAEELIKSQLVLLKAQFDKDKLAEIEEQRKMQLQLEQEHIDKQLVLLRKKNKSSTVQLEALAKKMKDKAFEIKQQQLNEIVLLSHKKQFKRKLLSP
jgi:hypothetical protein